MNSPVSPAQLAFGEHSGSTSAGGADLLLGLAGMGLVGLLATVAVSGVLYVAYRLIRWGVGLW
jgi:uncharacterized membrane protein